MIISSTSIELFDAALGALKETNAATHLAAWNYDNNIWLLHNEKFVAGFVNKFSHFCSANKSSVEENHYVIKSYLRISTLHILMLTKRLGLMLGNRWVELNVAIKKQRQHLVHRFNDHYFKNPIYHIFDFSLGKLLGHLKLAKSGDMRNCHALRGS